jgi:CubicO group peptidase (beta-lactamase class C family)
MASNAFGFSEDRLQRLSRLLKGYVDRGDLSCVSALIGQETETVYREKFGWQDIESETPVAFDTLFRIMSMTKPVTAVAALLLYEEGHFDLNTPIHEFLPAFEEMEVAVNWEEDGTPVTEKADTPVTFRHLFTHTAGLSYGFEPDTDPMDALYHKSLGKNGTYDMSITLQGLAERLGTIPLAFEPGTSWRYSVSLDVLGALVEVIAGESLADFMASRIFEPLGMTDTSFTVPDAKRDRLATVYQKNSKSGTLTPFDSRVPLPAMFWGGGGLVSSLDDYGRFAAMLANKGRLGEVQLLSPTTVSMFSINWAPFESLPALHVNHDGFGYSLGTAVLLDPSPTGQFGNRGAFTWGGAFSTYFWVDPTEALYGVLMTQFNPNGVYPLPERFNQLTYQAMVALP